MPNDLPLSLMFLAFFVALLTTITVVMILRPFAISVGLVDKPCLRKRHEGAIPLIGGPAIFAGLLIASAVSASWSSDQAWAILVLGFPVLVVGMADDRWNLSPSWRFGVEIPCCILAAYFFGVQLSSLGTLLPGVVLSLGWGALPFSVLGLVGVINALNMTDGVDGLAGGLSFLIFSSLAFLAYSSDHNVAMQLATLSGAILGFLFFNSRFFGRAKATIFMGDGGTLLVGFALGWYLIKLSQGPNAVITPVAALWIFAAPLFDTVSVMVRRIRRGQSPFHADREHFHHIFLLAGFGVNRTVLIILAFQVIYIAYAFASLYFLIPEWISFLLFLTVFAVYYYAMSHAWLLMKRLKHFREWAGFEDRRNAEHPVDTSGRRVQGDRREGLVAYSGPERRSGKSRRGDIDRRIILSAKNEQSPLPNNPQG